MNTGYIRSIYVPSTTEGKQWKVSFYKPQRGPGCVQAWEGETAHCGNVTFFKSMPLSSRSCKVTLPGRTTQKAVLTALHDMLQEMQAHEFIESQDIEPLIAKATL